MPSSLPMFLASVGSGVTQTPHFVHLIFLCQLSAVDALLCPFFDTFLIENAIPYTCTPKSSVQYKPDLNPYFSIRLYPWSSAYTTILSAATLTRSYTATISRSYASYVRVILPWPRSMPLVVVLLQFCCIFVALLSFFPPVFLQFSGRFYHVFWSSFSMFFMPKKGKNRQNIFHVQKTTLLLQPPQKRRFSRQLLTLPKVFFL